MEQRIEMLELVLRRLFKRKALVNLRSVFLKTHSVDIAAALGNFSESELLEIFKIDLDADKLSEIFSYLDEDLQKSLATEMDDKLLVQILVNMDSDDAAKILRLLSEEQSSLVLEKMKESDSDPMVELLIYPEGSAGSLMNTSVFCLKKDDSVKKAIQVLRQTEGLEAFYLYVVDAQNRLLGVLSLKQLLLSPEKTLLEDLMNTAVISASVSDSKEQVAHMVEKYDFLSIPVVAESHTLVGVITVDDVLDVIREEAQDNILASTGASSDSFGSQIWNRLSWVFFALIIGGMGSWIAYEVGVSLGLTKSVFWPKVGLLPVLVAVLSVIGVQTSAFATLNLNDKPLSFKKYFQGHIKREFVISILLSVLGFGLSTLVALLSNDLSYITTLGGVFTLMCWSVFVVYSLFPYFISKWHPDLINYSNLVSVVILDVIFLVSFIWMCQV